MKSSVEIKEIAAALSKAQGAMGAAKKESTNPHFRSRYADLSSIIEALQKPLADNGLSYVQSIVTNDKEECGVEMMVMHSSGEWLHFEPFFLPVQKADAQGFGSATTYSCRYQLRAVFGLPTIDDDGNAAVKAAPAGDTTEPPPPVGRSMKPSDFQAHCTAFSNATTLEALQAAYTIAVMAARKVGDAQAEASFKTKKDEAKKFLDDVKKRDLATQA